MSLIDVKVFNLLVHYGLEKEKNLIDLLEEALLEKLGEETVVRTKEYMYPNQVEFEKIGTIYYLKGYLFKSSTLKWKTVPGKAGRHEEDPGDKQVLPYSRFFLDIENHRLFWVTERGLTNSPTAWHFKSYIKKLSLQLLRENYKAEAERLWKAGKANRHQKKDKFVSEYLAERYLTRKLFSVELQPEVSSEKILEIINAKHHLVKKAVFYPRLNNASRNHVTLLFTNQAKIATDLKATSETSFVPEIPSGSLEKKELANIIEANDTEQILDFEFKIKDSRQSHSRQFTLASSGNDHESSIEKVETLQEDINEENLLSKILTKVKNLKPRDVTAEVRRNIKARVRAFID